MRILRSWALVVAVPLLLAAAVYLVAGRSRPIEVRVVKVGRGRVEETVSSTKAGAIRSRNASSLSVETAGIIVGIHAREGARVKQGDHLISIDRRDADAAGAAALTEQRVLEAQKSEAAARLKDARRELERMEPLHRTGVVTDAQFDQAKMQAEVMASALAAAEARIEAQKAVVSRARIAADKCDLHAPFDAVVAELKVEVGEWTLPGQVAMRLVDPGRLYVRAELDEVDLGQVKVGLPARIRLDPYRARKIGGTVVRVAPVVSELQEQNRTVEIEVEIGEGAEGLDLKPGTSADVEVVLKSVDDVERVPSMAVMEGDKALVVGADGRATTLVLKAGLRNWEYVQVLGGLKQGDLVIVSLESDKVKDGVEVRVAREGP